ncbi:sugar ABC transporter permease [Pelosinus sp. IPA-1]|nr:sugar ABC transporter permease [Pelosinus sp. IPA-1]
MKIKYSSEYFRSERKGFAFVLPALLFMLAFVGYPIIYNFILSVYHVDIMTLGQQNKEFVGLQNYIDVFNNPTMMTSIWNTLLFTIGSISIQFVIGFALALFFNLDFTLAKPMRGLLVVAWMIPMTVIALLSKFMLSPSGGIINELLLNLHLIDQPIGWLINNSTALWGVILANSWVGIPFNMILLTTGLSNISKSLYEAAEVDGASSLQKFVYITLPQLRPAILSVVILGFIYTFKVFDLVFVATGGGPVNATELMSTFAYKLSFAQFLFSKGATVANVLFIILFIVSLGYLKLIRKDEVIH